MAHQEESHDGVARNDSGWRGPEVERGADGQRSSASQGAGRSDRNAPGDPDGRKQ